MLTGLSPFAELIHLVKTLNERSCVSRQYDEWADGALLCNSIRLASNIDFDYADSCSNLRHQCQLDQNCYRSPGNFQDRLIWLPFLSKSALGTPCPIGAEG